MVKMLSVSSFTYLVQVWVLCLCYLSMYEFQILPYVRGGRYMYGFPCLNDTVFKNFVYLHVYLSFFSFFLFLSFRADYG